MPAGCARARDSALPVSAYVGSARRTQSAVQHIRDGGWRTPAEIGAELHIHYSSVKRFALEGVLKARRINDKGDILTEPVNGPLPRPHRGKPLRDHRRYPKLAPHVRKELQYEA